MADTERPWTVQQIECAFSTPYSVPVFLESTHKNVYKKKLMETLGVTEGKVSSTKAVVDKALITPAYRLASIYNGLSCREDQIETAIVKKFTAKLE
jgi:hypothetical protein